MDVATYLAYFENSLSSFTGDDPLDPWDKFVDYLVQKLPAGGRDDLSKVLDSLVHRFLKVERYANDSRYVNYCIRWAGYYSEPVTLFSYIFSHGVGVRTAELYVAWAKHFEEKGQTENAETVYQKGLENQAQPADTLLLEYRHFQTRTRSQAAASAGSRHPLVTSHLTNQVPPQREPLGKAMMDCVSKPPDVKSIIFVSRSEVPVPVSSSSSSVQIPAYLKEELVCEGSELCFEEVRAHRYFREKQEQQAKQKREDSERPMADQTCHNETTLGLEQSFDLLEVILKEENEVIQHVLRSMETLGQWPVPSGLTCQPLPEREPRPVECPAPTMDPHLTQQAPQRPLQPSNILRSRHSLGLRLHIEPPLVQEAPSAACLRVGQMTETPAAPFHADRSLHVTSPIPDTPSVAHASVVQSPERQDPDPVPAFVTAIDSDPDGRGSQDRTFTNQDHSHLINPEDKLDESKGTAGNLSHVTPNSSLGHVQATPSRVLPSPTVNTREALDVIMDMFQAPTCLSDLFGNSSALLPPDKPPSGTASNFSFAKPAAPFTIFQDDDDNKENQAASSSVVEKPRPVKPLAEITLLKAEKSETPPDLMPDESTMWGARYNSLKSLAACPNSTSDFSMLAQCVSTPFMRKTPTAIYQEQDCTSDVVGADENAFVRRQTQKLSPIIEQSPPEDQLSVMATSRIAPSSATPGTIVGEGVASHHHILTVSSTTLVQPPPPAALSFSDHTLGPSECSAAKMEPEARRERFTILEEPSSPAPSRLMEPCDVAMSPERVRVDWPVFESPQAIGTEPDLDAFLSPSRAVGIQDVPMSPELLQQGDDEPMSPDKSLNGGPPPSHLISDPWDGELISELLSGMTPALTSHPHCVNWMCNLPNITPKMTLSIGKASLRVDCVLGNGAFATVYQATDPETSEKIVMKVQKPANPWEFYIHTQLDARLPSQVRHLYSNVLAAHLFTNGSVLLTELHGYGTLLNVINMYKSSTDKVMPQPLAMFFTHCLLHMVEQLHAVNIIHADMKPDNFMLGQRFLDTGHVDLDSMDHGLVLIDMGQSIDMALFPEGTAFTAHCQTSSFQCVEMLNGKPWNYQTDYFCLAGTVHCLLFGTYMKVMNEGGVWKTNGVFRRNPHSDLWQDFFQALLNGPDGSVLSRLRRRLASVLQENYSWKLASLKSRLVVQLLEARQAKKK